MKKPARGGGCCSVHVLRTLSAGLVASSCGLTCAFAQSSSDLPRTGSSPDYAHALEQSFEHVAEVVGPATVRITVNIASPVQAASGGSGGDNDFPSFFGENPQSAPSSIGRAYGSGVIIRADGYILTNDHVVEEAVGGKVLVTLSDNSVYAGTVVRDSSSDLAVVKINAGKPLPFLKLGVARLPRVGQWVIAIGAPYNQPNTVTAGIVSALHREQMIDDDGQSTRRFYADLIQIDASINPGNSGGPLVNIDGELIGINVASIFRAHLGLAIPVNVAKMVADQLISHGKVTRSILGIQLTSIPAFVSRQVGADRGAYVIEVGLDTPADRAGLQPGDIVTRFGKETIDDESSLRFAISNAAPHSSVPITLLRGGQPKTVSAVLDNRDAAETETIAASVGGMNGTAQVSKRVAADLGIRVRALSPAYSATLSMRPALRGVIVAAVNIGSPAADADLRPGSVITAVNGNPVTSLESFSAALAALKREDVIALNVFLPARGNQSAGRGLVNIEAP